MSTINSANKVEELIVLETEPLPSKRTTIGPNVDRKISEKITLIHLDDQSISAQMKGKMGLITEDHKS